MLAADFVELLRCPVTHQRVTPADTEVIQRVNERIGATVAPLCNLAGEPIDRLVEELLVRADGTVGYPVREGIPILLADEAIALT